jgi:hypothetical protein
VWLGKAQADVWIEICPIKIADMGLKAELENQDAPHCHKAVHTLHCCQLLPTEQSKRHIDIFKKFSLLDVLGEV